MAQDPRALINQTGGGHLLSRIEHREVRDRVCDFWKVKLSAYQVLIYQTFKAIGRDSFSLFGADI